MERELVWVPYAVFLALEIVMLSPCRTSYVQPLLVLSSPPMPPSFVLSPNRQQLPRD
jgi:hypothetical protein